MAREPWALVWAATADDGGPGERTGWITVNDLPGWDSHSVEVRAEVVDGEQRVTSLRLIARDGAEGRGLTGQRLRSLPLQQLAEASIRAHAEDGEGMRRALAQAGRRKAHKHDPRAATDVSQVAEIYRLARRLGLPPRREIVHRLHISERTADRYIKRARAAGLLDSTP